MSASAKGTVEKPGRNVRQKSGLNRAILDQGWGRFRVMLAYKLADRGGRLVEVPAAYTSQTCSVCGCVDAASRQSQATFVCVRCGHTANAAVTTLGPKGPSFRALRHVLPVSDRQPGSIRRPTPKVLRFDVFLSRCLMFAATGNRITAPNPAVNSRVCGAKIWIKQYIEQQDTPAELFKSSLIQKKVWSIASNGCGRRPVRKAD